MTAGVSNPRWNCFPPIPLLALLAALTGGAPVAAARTYDVVVYGGTSAGVIAAVQAAEMGKATLLIEPGRHFGGMTSGGLSETDIGDSTTVGGLARQFYGYVYQYYHPQRVAARYQAQSRLSFSLALPDDSHLQWLFEPHVAESIFSMMLHGARVATLRGERLNRETGVTLSNGRISSIQMESGRIITGQVFIDATYEGDLMAAAKIDWRIGRESVDQYGEALAGVFPDNFLTGIVDPHIVPGDASSGLLPGVDTAAPGAEGTGDRRVQAYNLRLCFTDDPQNRAVVPKPASYDPMRYELLARFVQRFPNCQFSSGILKFGALPGDKVDVNSNAFSTDMPGPASYGWAQASYATRAAILQQYQEYTQGLFWFLAHDPRLPDATRAEAAQWGPALDEFTDNANWPAQLYIREARRMVGAYVMTEMNAEGLQMAPHPVALASYGMDSHVVTYSTDGNGALTTEGYFFAGVDPYPISYDSLTPQSSQCQNLLVPVCLSATHVAINSLRMEPVYMMLGQAAATAACLAIDEGQPVQKVDYNALSQRLQADGQILNWTAPGSN